VEPTEVTTPWAVDEVEGKVEVSLQLLVELGRVAMPCAEDVEEAEASVLSAVVGTKLRVVNVPVVKDEAGVSLQLSLTLEVVAMLDAEEMREELREVSTPWPVDVGEGRLKTYGPQEVEVAARPSVEDVLEDTTEVLVEISVELGTVAMP
jgi:hypothetical protein